MSVPIRSSEHYIDVAYGNKGIVVVKCGAKWCKPCVNSHHGYDCLAAQYPNAKFFTLDIDEITFEDSEIVTVLPTFLLFNKGEPVGKMEGVDFDELSKIISLHY